MKVGLLVCDHLDSDVVEELGGDYDTTLFPDVFAPVGIEFQPYEVTAGEFPGSVDECDGWMTTGSRRSAYEDVPWIHQVADLLAEITRARRPLVAVCFGHQLLAMALGGRVGPAEVGWGVGVQEFDITEQFPWMSPERSTLRMLMSHRDQVLEMPEGATRFASSDYCPIAGYSIGDHVLSVQGHPEFVPELSRLLLDRRRELIGAETTDRAIASLEGPFDRELVAAWIGEFYRRAGA